MGVFSKVSKQITLRNSLLCAAITTLMLLLLIIADSNRHIMVAAMSPKDFWLIFQCALTAAFIVMLALTLASGIGLQVPRFGTAGCLVSGCMSLPLIYFAGSQPAILVIAGACMGVSFAHLIAIIEAELHQFLRVRALSIIAGSLSIAAFIKLIVTLWATEGLGLIAWIAFYGALFASLALFMQQSKQKTPQEAVTPNKHDLGKFFQQNWVVIGCLLLCVFTTACIWGANSASLAIRSDSEEGDSFASALGSLVAGILLFIATLAIQRSPHTRLQTLGNTIYKMGPIACLSLLVIGWLLQTGGLDFPGPSARANPMYGFCVATIGALFLAIYSKEGCSTAVLPFAVPLVNTLVIGFALLTMGLFPILGDPLAQSVSISLRIIFLTIVILSLVRPKSKQEEETYQQEKVLAQRYGLSEREIEILILLLEKRSAPYIAEKLFISNNTVKTHIRRIYEKTDVHSREELTDLFQ